VQGVVHRDLKPENFLLASKAPDAAVKLTDFGLSAVLRAPEELLHEQCGSAYYIAPEILSRAGYGSAVDNFALGVVLYIMLSGTVPFGDGNRAEKEIYRAIQHDALHFGGGWASITGAAKELISGLLEKDPAKRYTTEQALAHAWVSGDAASDAPIDRAMIEGLLAYNARNHLKRAAVHLVASHLTAKDVQSLRATFMKMDADGSGTITRAEMAEAMRGMGVAERDPSVFKRVIDAVDADGDGRISWEEFLEASLEPQMVKYQQQVWQAFCAMDTDGDGHISIAELKTVLADEPTDKIEKYIAEFDLNKDGNIDYEEFLRMLLPKNIKVRVGACCARACAPPPILYSSLSTLCPPLPAVPRARNSGDTLSPRYTCPACALVRAATRKTSHFKRKFRTRQQERARAREN
jgi:calcium-dependent protein kinase